VKRFMDVLGQNLDQETFKKIMEANGRACFRGAHGETTPNPPADALEKFMERYNSYEAHSVYREGNVIRYKYIGNPQGLEDLRRPLPVSPHGDRSEGDLGHLLPLLGRVRGRGVPRLPREAGAGGGGDLAGARRVDEPGDGVLK
jgi:hypothetical protein